MKILVTGKFDTRTLEHIQRIVIEPDDGRPYDLLDAFMDESTQVLIVKEERRDGT